MKTAEFYRGISLPEEAIELLEKVKDTDEKEMKVLFQNNREAFYKNILKRENTVSLTVFFLLLIKFIFIMSV